MASSPANDSRPVARASKTCGGTHAARTALALAQRERASTRNEESVPLMRVLARLADSSTPGAASIGLSEANGTATLPVPLRNGAGYVPAEGEIGARVRLSSTTTIVPSWWSETTVDGQTAPWYEASSVPSASVIASPLPIHFRSGSRLP